jgi:hypothetical protein
MQRFLARQQLVVGQDVINFDVMKHMSHGDIEGLNVDITNNVKEAHLSLMRGECL